MNLQILKRTMPRCLYKFCCACFNNIRIARAQHLTEKNRIVKIHHNEKMRIVFIVQRTEVFNSVRTVFEAAVACDECEVYLLPLPRCSNENKELLWDTYTSVVEFCHILNGGEVLNTYDFETNTYYDLIKLMPDYIFLNVPYTVHYPDVYSLEKLASISKVCYVPYGYVMSNENKYSDLYAEMFNVNLMQYISFLFVDGDASYSYCKKNRMWLSENIFGKRLYNVGYPRFDTIDAHVIQPTKNTILWLPRWTASKQIESGNLESHFFDYSERLFEYVDCQDYYNLIIRPHPLMFENFIKCGLLSDKDVLEYKEAIKKNGKIFLDEKPSYDEAFSSADILVADCSSIIIEFFLRGKPVIYCGRREELSQQIADVTKTFYYVSEWEELKAILDELKNGVDPLWDERKLAVERFRAETRSAGETIFNTIRNDYVSSKGKALD